MKNLLKPVKLGSLNLKNRVLLAPMTRMRAEKDGTPNDLVAEFYSQRASFGLIITECTPISATCNTYPGATAIYDEKHVDGWKRVIEKVHSKGGKIAIQAYHCGRSGSSAILGAHPVAPSPIAINGNDFLTSKPYEVPHELTKSEINKILDDFHKSAVLAKKAGFDAIQLHGANGYLVDQFLRDGTNQRKDEYGGSVQNRSRFCLEAADRLIDVFGSDRVIVRLSPTDRFNDMYDSKPLELLNYLLPALDKKKLAFVEVKRNSPFDHTKDTSGRVRPEDQVKDLFKTVRGLLKNTPYVANEGVTIQEAEQLLQDNIVDAVTFAKLGISNPDLPQRIQKDYPLNTNIDFSKVYTGGNSGYTDYPVYTPTN